MVIAASRGTRAHALGIKLVTSVDEVFGKVWVHGPGQEPWEVYTVEDVSATFGKDSPATVTPAACCAPDATTGQLDQNTQPAGCCA